MRAVLFRSPALAALVLILLGLWTTLAPAQTFRVGPNAASAPPAQSLGTESDYFLDLNTGYVYGPKASGIWPTLPSYTIALLTGTVATGHMLVGCANNTVCDSGYAVNTSGSASRDPNANDDVTKGYVPGSLFQNISTGTQWVCLTNGAGTATWHSVGSINTVPIPAVFLTQIATAPSFSYITPANNALGINANFAITSPIAGIINRLYVNVATLPAAGQTYTFTIAIWNWGSNPTFSTVGVPNCTITSAGNGSCSDTSDTISVAAGQRWAILAQQSGSTNQGQSSAAVGYSPQQ